jgi:hypothetical protein
MKLTIKQLMTATPQSVKDRISGLGIHDRKKTPWIKRDKTNEDDKSTRRKAILKDSVVRHNGMMARGFFCDAALHNKDSSGTFYRLMIKNFGTKREPDNWLFKDDSRIWVHCSCPYFKYYLEVALWVKGCTELLSLGRGNAYRPRIRNPRMKAYLCKHLYSTLVYLKEQDQKKSRYQGPF